MSVSKTPKIRPKNDRISAVLGQILIKLPQLCFYGLKRTVCGNLIKIYRILNELDLLLRGAINTKKRRKYDLFKEAIDARKIK